MISKSASIANSKFLSLLIYWTLYAVCFWLWDHSWKWCSCSGIFLTTGSCRTLPQASYQRRRWSWRTPDPGPFGRVYYPWGDWYCERFDGKYLEACLLWSVLSLPWGIVSFYHFCKKEQMRMTFNTCLWVAMLSSCCKRSFFSFRTAPVQKYF